MPWTHSIHTMSGKFTVEVEMGTISWGHVVLALIMARVCMWVMAPSKLRHKYKSFLEPHVKIQGMQSHSGASLTE